MRRLHIENKSQNIKILKETGTKNLRDPKFIEPKEIMDPNAKQNLTEIKKVIRLLRN